MKGKRNQQKQKSTILTDIGLMHILLKAHYTKICGTKPDIKPTNAKDFRKRVDYNSPEYPVCYGQ